MAERRKKWLVAVAMLLSTAMLAAPAVQLGPTRARYDDADWKLKGAGVVCCPCSVPCPCRSNAQPSYGHCEATLYLRIAHGSYGAVSLDNMQVVSSGGMCATHPQGIDTLYFEPTASRSQQLAFMKLWASFSAGRVADFAHVRILPIHSELTGGNLFKVVIPDTLEMTVDRNWGRDSLPMPLVAAQDNFSNTLQYAQNIRYSTHDVEAGLDFDYSRRQANYREVDLSVQQYRSKQMLVQFANGQGWFTTEQMKLIRAQRLVIPQIDWIRDKAKQMFESAPK